MGTLDMEKQYRAELRAAAVLFREQNRPAYAQIVSDVTALYRAQNKGFARCMAEIERRSAYANGLPETFETWLATHTAGAA